MGLIGLVLGLCACYFPSVSGIRGRGSRGLWIAFIFLGVCIALATAKLGTMVAPDGIISQLMMQILMRVAASFSLGSLLAALFFRKKQQEQTLGLK
jgi:hypothetical protein